MKTPLRPNIYTNVVEFEIGVNCNINPFFVNEIFLNFINKNT